MIKISFWTAIASILLFFWSLFILWLSIFIAPFENLEMLWIIVPVWLVWFFSEFFQEKRGTSFGNAISNGVVALWVGIDWIRYLIRLIGEGEIDYGMQTYSKFFLSFIVFVYGLIIIIYGIKTRSYIKYIGRIREITYVLLMLSPVVYGIVEMHWKTALAMILFFPLFYYVIEIIDTRTPNPKTYESDGPKERSFGESSNQNFRKF